MWLKNIYNYFFLVFFTGMISLSFLPKQMGIQVGTNVWDFPIILISGIVLTSVFLCLNHQSVSSIIWESFTWQKEDQDHRDSFIGNLVKGISKRDVLLISAITLLAFFIFSHRLDVLDLWDDEYLVLKAAEGYHQTGTFNAWDFVKHEITQTEYNRAWPHTWLVAQSYGLFGVSVWSSRIVSVLFGCLFVFSSFFTLFYFTKNTFFSIVVAFVLMLNPDFIYYFRYTRMYAVVMPLFLWWSVFVFQAIEGRSHWVERCFRKTTFINQFLSFDYLFAALSIFILFWCYNIQITTLLLVPAALFYIFFMALVTRGKKYIGVIVITSISGLGIYLLLPENGMLKHHMQVITFLESCRPIYLKLFVQKPFFCMANLSLLSGSLIVFLCSHEDFRKRLFFCLLIIITPFFLFTYVANYHSQHYRYICHVIPFAILLICLVYFIILKVFQNKYIFAIGMMLLLASQAFQFVGGMEYLYKGARGQPYPSIAYATVRNNLKPNEVIFAQFLRDYYMRGIPPDTPLIDLGYVRQGTTGTNPYQFDRFFKDLHTYKQGWIVWQKYKEYHIDPKIVAYVMTLFKKYNGQGVDHTGVEVYYFDQSMIKTPNFK